MLETLSTSSGGGGGANASRHDGEGLSLHSARRQTHGAPRWGARDGSPRSHSLSRRVVSRGTAVALRSDRGRRGESRAATHTCWGRRADLRDAQEEFWHAVCNILYYRNGGIGHGAQGRVIATWRDRGASAI